MSNVEFIAKGNTQEIEKFINYLMHDGKKSIARKILRDTFDILQQRTKQDPAKVFKEALDNIKPAMEVRAKRIGGAVYQIPVEVKPYRQFQLACRWLLAAARGKKGSPMAKRLADELLQAANNEGASIKKKEDTHRMAQANKAFAHFARF